MNHTAIFRNRKFELGESIDEERNQEESCCKESSSQEKEVSFRASTRALSTLTCSEEGSGNGAFFLF
jgi:hypothetical protein